MYPYSENSKNCYMLCGERSLRHHFRYKYHLLIEKSTDSWQKLPILMLGELVVLIPENASYQWFHKELQAWTHFVPIKSDFSDLRQKVEWLQQNDGKAREIGRRAKYFARLHF